MTSTLQNLPDAVILSTGYFNTHFAKTAHGLIQFSFKYNIRSVIDSSCAGEDAGYLMDGQIRDIPVVSSLDAALNKAPDTKYLIIGIAVAGGALPDEFLPVIEDALKRGLHIINGLQRFLSDDPALMALAEIHGGGITDVRKLFNNLRIPFKGRIKDVTSPRIVVLGTDGIIGKRTTAILLHDHLKKSGFSSEFIAMGQTGWMQGFEYSVVIDSVILDFVTGAIEDAVYRAWEEKKPSFIVSHGEGAMCHPSDPGGFELVAAARPRHIILQHDPFRTHYRCFPDYEMAGLEKELKLIELFSGFSVTAITLYSKTSDKASVLNAAREIEKKYKVMTRVPAIEGVEDIISEILT